MSLQFEYTTQAKPGAPFVRKKMTATSQALAEKRLLDRQIPCLKLKKLGSRLKSPKKLKLKDLEQFAQQMQTTQEVQMNVVTALELARDMATKKWIAKTFEKMRVAITEGSTLHEAMRRSQAFDELTLGLVSAGEKAGFLEKSFEQIKELTRRSIMVKSKIIGLMIYPAIVISIAVAAVFVLMLKTVPEFTNMYASADMELPLPTKVLVAMSDFVVANVGVGLIAVATLIFGIFKIPAIYRKFPFLHPLLLRVPAVGAVQKKLIQATFTRTLSDMLGAQTRIIDALYLCRDISTNYVFKGHVARAIVSISKGGKVGQSFTAANDVLGILLIKALTFGDVTGKIEEILVPLSKSLDRELGEYIDQIKTVIEPVMTLIIGGIVLFIMLAMFVPVFNMSRALG